MIDDPIKITAEFQRVAQSFDNEMQIGVRISGREVISVTAPSYDRAANPLDLSREEAAALGKAAFDFANRLYVDTYRATVGSLPHASRSGMDIEHPNERLRRDLEGLQKSHDDLADQLRTVTVQRDELRRLFVEPLVISGQEQPVRTE